MTHGSLFAGIGGFDLGFERAGIKTIWQVEINEYCRRVLAKHFPDAERFGDIRNCGVHNLKSVDIISGGFPWQDISNAGRRKGIEAERSGLWREYLRIVRELRPGIAVMENVPALLSMGFGRILGELAASRYDAEWDCIPASVFGAPHRRDRIWILAYPQRAEWWSERGLAGADNGILQRQKGSSWTGGRGKDVAYSMRQRLEERIMLGRLRSGSHEPFEGQEFAHHSAMVDSASEGFPDWAGGTVGQPSPLTEFERPTGREIERDFRGMAHGVSRRVDRLKGLGNAVVPQIAEWIGRRIVEAYEPTQ